MAVPHGEGTLTVHPEQGTSPRRQFLNMLFAFSELAPVLKSVAPSQTNLSHGSSEHYVTAWSAFLMM